MLVDLLSRRSLVALVLLALMLVPLGTVAQEASPESSSLPSPAPSDAPPLATSPGGTWAVTAFDPWGETLVEPLPASSLALALLGEGRLEGETGCGRFNGGWWLDGDVLTMGAAPTGFVGCGEREIEESIGLNAALEAVTGWAPVATGVELLDGAGRARVVLRYEIAAEPTGAWAVIRYRRPNGQLTEPLPEGPMTLELGTDGSARGSTGCRLLEGVYRRDGAGVVIGPLDTVGLPCEGGVRKAERQFLRALGDVVYWGRTGDTLALNDGFDELLVELVVDTETSEAGG